MARRVLRVYDVERVEVGLVDHAVGGEQVGEDGRRGAGVGECVVGPVEGDVVAGAQVGEPVEELAVGIEAAGELQRAQPAIERERHAGAAGGALDERGVELGVVGREHGAVETAAQLFQRVGRPRRAAQRAGG